MKFNNKIKLGFTLIEIMVGILIVSVVLIAGFKALSAVTIGKSRLIQQTDLQKESFYFTQKLFEQIKQGGTLDYEEYFNRKILGNATSSGHYLKPSGFGNFGSGGLILSNLYGDGFYYCISENGIKMTGTGCINRFNEGSVDYSGKQQRYGEYSFQFIDYNSNYDDDGGDENLDLEIRFDDDDEYLGEGPEVFDSGTDVKELYLISGDKKHRTLFRWNIDDDLDGPSGEKRGTIEYLKLEGVDYGIDHIVGSSDNTEGDGVIDTWIVDTNIDSTNIVAGSIDMDKYWISLFPDSINVSEFKIFAYPNKDVDKAWKENINISPYIDLKIKIKPSWKSRKLIKGAGKQLEFSMTINLNEIYSK